MVQVDHDIRKGVRYSGFDPSDPDHQRMCLMALFIHIGSRSEDVHDPLPDLIYYWNKLALAQLKPTT